MRRVVITGLGAISPIGLSMAESFQAALEGKSGVTKITRFDCTGYASQIAAEVKGFNPELTIDKKEIKKLDHYSQYALAAGVEAWEDAGLNSSQEYSAERMGCLLGVGIGGLTYLEHYHTVLLESGPRRISPFLIPAMISNLGPGNLAIRFGLKGVNFTVTSACTSATHAIGEAFRYIRDGSQDLIMTGGSESAVNAIGIAGFCAMKALSTRNEEPEKASRPFDRDRDGFVLGEGSCILILEEYESAKRRGAKMYAEVVGYGTSCDAYHITAPSEGGEGAERAMRMALEMSSLRPNEIDYVNAHGTSTDANDRNESAAIARVFEEHAHNGLCVSSTKSVTGHLLGAAGAIEAAFSLLAMRDGKIPPTINLDQPGEGCTLDYVPNVARDKAVKACLSNSFGFGGTNASLVFKAVG